MRARAHTLVSQRPQSHYRRFSFVSYWEPANRLCPPERAYTSPYSGGLDVAVTPSG